MAAGFAHGFVYGFVGVVFGGQFATEEGALAGFVFDDGAVLALIHQHKLTLGAGFVSMDGIPGDRKIFGLARQFMRHLAAIPANRDDATGQRAMPGMLEVDFIAVDDRMGRRLRLERAL